MQMNHVTGGLKIHGSGDEMEHLDQRIRHVNNEHPDQREGVMCEIKKLI